MNALLFGLALGGLFGCYDIVRRMDRRTNHMIRVAVILMGCGCITTMAQHQDLSLALLLAGLGLFHAFDRRGDHGRYREMQK